MLYYLGFSALIVTLCCSAAISLFPPCYSPHRFKQNLDYVNKTETHQFANRYGHPANHRLVQRRGAVTDLDSDEEIRRMVAAQDASHAALQEADEDNLEVVGLDYLAKSSRSCQQQKGKGHF